MADEGNDGGEGIGTATDPSPAGDRFAVGIHLTQSELEFVVEVPSAIDSGWSDPETFQSLVEQRTWERLDQESTLRSIATPADPGDTVRLGTITLQPDGAVVSASLSLPEGDSSEKNGDGSSPNDGV
jgi:hypothetical protein